MHILMFVNGTNFDFVLLLIHKSGLLLFLSLASGVCDQKVKPTPRICS
jgi:hypothetical protein